MSDVFPLFLPIFYYNIHIYIIFVDFEHTLLSKSMTGGRNKHAIYHRNNQSVNYYSLGNSEKKLI